MIKKDEIYEVDIIDSGINSEGIAKIDNFTVFVENAILGEIVKIKIIKVNKSYAYSKIIKIIKKSNYRTLPICECYGKCGGCMLQHMSYDYQLYFKTNAVKNIMRKIGLDNIVSGCIGMGIPYNYRNKGQFPIGLNKDNYCIFGFYKNNSHDIVSFDNCYLQKDISNRIVKEITNYINNSDISIYNENNHTGLIRNVLIRCALHTNQIMVVFICNDSNNKVNVKKLNLLATHLALKFNEINTIIENINTNRNNTILGMENIVLTGDGVIFEYIDKFIFQISPNSFFQVNSLQAELLYNLTKELLDLNKEDILFDLYCGTGTIGIFLAEHCKKVYGIEIIPQAIEDANLNRKINEIDNIEFFVGDTEIEAEKLINKGIIPSAIVVDPPRKGLSNKTIDLLKLCKAKKIVYISCNPATLMRDLDNLKEYYNVGSIIPVDMFPQTKHVECVSLLVRKTIEK